MYIAIDFDGTIVEHRYPAIGDEIPFAIDTLIKIQQELRHHLILWTVREGNELEAAVEFCKTRGLEFYAINQNHPGGEQSLAPRKLMADLFIDDRNFGGVPDWGHLYQVLKHNPKKAFTADGFTLNALRPVKKKKSWWLF